ncbi:hypothetical protein LX32DRAFT_684953 [Colletotrichum zoysiae]|uniref:Uncharacterized protein n=1 Tax=Colletotrichum zoysiae TaxID=1216348 RepID=A0AAD9HBK4_9PEZI|nr:hypothetical protein LX32DRAFT_684953 [Colletotrichum zoysiae]
MDELPKPYSEKHYLLAQVLDTVHLSTGLSSQQYVDEKLPIVANMLNDLGYISASAQLHELQRQTVAGKKLQDLFYKFTQANGTPHAADMRNQDCDILGMVEFLPGENRIDRMSRLLLFLQDELDIWDPSDPHAEARFFRLDVIAKDATEEGIEGVPHIIEEIRGGGFHRVTDGLNKIRHTMEEVRRKRGYSALKMAEELSPESHQVLKQFDYTSTTVLTPEEQEPQTDDENTRSSQDGRTHDSDTGDSDEDEDEDEDDEDEDEDDEDEDDEDEDDEDEVGGDLEKRLNLPEERHASSPENSGFVNIGEGDKISTRSSCANGTDTATAAACKRMKHRNKTLLFNTAEMPGRNGKVVLEAGTILKASSKEELKTLVANNYPQTMPLIQKQNLERLYCLLATDRDNLVFRQPLRLIRDIEAPFTPAERNGVQKAQNPTVMRAKTLSSTTEISGIVKWKIESALIRYKLRKPPNWPLEKIGATLKAIKYLERYSLGDNTYSKHALLECLQSTIDSARHPTRTVSPSFDPEVPAADPDSGKETEEYLPMLSYPVATIVPPSRSSESEAPDTAYDNHEVQDPEEASIHSKNDQDNLPPISLQQTADNESQISTQKRDYERHMKVLCYEHKGDRPPNDSIQTGFKTDDRK